MTNRINKTFKIDETLAAEIDRVANERGIFKADIIENAVSEYLDVDRYARIEQKLDRLLESEGLGTETPLLSREQKPEKEKKTQTDGGTDTATPTTTESDTIQPPTPETETTPNTETDTDTTTETVTDWYRPDTGVADTLTTDDLRELLQSEEPELNPEDVGTLPRAREQKAGVLAAIIRYEQNGIVHHSELTDYVGDLLGSSDHIMQSYLDDGLLTDHFYQMGGFNSGQDNILKAGQWEWRPLYYVTADDFAENIQPVFERVTTIAHTGLSAPEVMDFYQDEEHIKSASDIAREASTWLSMMDTQLIQAGVLTESDRDGLKKALADRFESLKALEALAESDATREHAEEQVGGEVVADVLDAGYLTEAF